MAHFFPARHGRLPEQTGQDSAPFLATQERGGSQVEMAGVEPASRRFEPESTTSLVALLCLARADPEQQGSTQASRCGAYGIPASGPSYRRPWAGTPGLLTPAAFPPGAGKGGRDRRCGQATLDAGLRSQGEGGRLCSCFGTLGLPSFIAVRAPRLAIRTQPPLSRPFHPQVPLVRPTLYHNGARNSSFRGRAAGSAELRPDL